MFRICATMLIYMFACEEFGYKHARFKAEAFITVDSPPGCYNDQVSILIEHPNPTLILVKDEKHTLINYAKLKDEWNLSPSLRCKSFIDRVTVTLEEISTRRVLLKFVNFGREDRGFYTIEVRSRQRGVAPTQRSFYIGDYRQSDQVPTLYFTTENATVQLDHHVTHFTVNNDVISIIVATGNSMFADIGIQFGNYTYSECVFTNLCSAWVPEELKRYNDSLNVRYIVDYVNPCMQVIDENLTLLLMTEKTAPKETMVTENNLGGAETTAKPGETTVSHIEFTNYDLINMTVMIDDVIMCVNAVTCDVDVDKLNVTSPVAGTLNLRCSMQQTDPDERSTEPRIGQNDDGDDNSYPVLIVPLLLSLVVNCGLCTVLYIMCGCPETNQWRQHLEQYRKVAEQRPVPNAPVPENVVLQDQTSFQIGQCPIDSEVNETSGHELLPNENGHNDHI